MRRFCLAKNKTKILWLGFPILEKTDESPASLRMTAFKKDWMSGARDWLTDK